MSSSFYYKAIDTLFIKPQSNLTNFKCCSWHFFQFLHNFPKDISQTVLKCLKKLNKPTFYIPSFSETNEVAILIFTDCQFLTNCVTTAQINTLTLFNRIHWFIVYRACLKTIHEIIQKEVTPIKSLFNVIWCLKKQSRFSVGFGGTNCKTRRLLLIQIKRFYSNSNGGSLVGKLIIRIKHQK